MINSETWAWECIGTNNSPAFLGIWQASAYVYEGPLGWYAAAEGQKTGPDYVYRLPGRLAPGGPYSRDAAEGIARQMIGLTADASCPSLDQLVLYREPALSGRKEYEALDVTGGRWALADSGPAHPCMICDETITNGWSEGSWKQARRFVCITHVEVRLEERPAVRGLPTSWRARRFAQRRPEALADANVSTPAQP